MKNKKPLSFEEQGEAYAGAAKQLDAERIAQLDRNALLLQVDADSEARELKRLQQKYGEQHPRVKKQQQTVQYHQQLQVAVARERQRSATFGQQVAGKGWRVYGQLTDRSGQGLEHYTIALSDSKGSLLEGAPYACTDAQGYFSLIFEEALLMKKRSWLGKSFSLRVSGQKGALCKISEEPVTVDAGKQEFRILLLDKPNCTPPKDENDQPNEPDGPILPVKPGPPVEPVKPVQPVRPINPNEPVKPNDPSLPDYLFVVQGTVKTKSGKIPPRVRVEVFDKKNQLNPEASGTLTDKDGSFYISLSIKTHEILFKERFPIFLRVLDVRSGDDLWNSPLPLPFAPGQSLQLNVVV